MALNPWEYAEKTNTEHAHQVALFMWSSMAEKFGVMAAEDRNCYDSKQPGYAVRTYGPPRGDNGVFPLFWLHAIKNQGHGDAIRGARSAEEGVKPGVPDMFLPWPIVRVVDRLSINAHGLYIELKRPATVGMRKGSVDKEQVRWGEYLAKQGYAVEVAYGWLEARACICRYLGIIIPNL